MHDGGERVAPIARYRPAAANRTTHRNRFFAYLDPKKRAQVAAALPPQSLTAFPELRRQVMRPLLNGYKRDAIRPHVPGHFKDLLPTMARRRAMLYYLDNSEPVSPDVLPSGHSP